MDKTGEITQIPDNIGGISKPQETVKVEKNERMQQDSDYEQECKTDGIYGSFEEGKLGKARGISQSQDTKEMKDDLDREQQDKFGEVFYNITGP